MRSRMVSNSPCFYFGPGQLYGWPFMARCLLYRLHAVNCSILVYHKPNIADGSVDVVEDESANVMQTTSVHHTVTEVFVHYANSSTAALSKLAASKPIELKLSEGLSPRCAFGEIGVVLERVQLPCKEMFFAFPSRGLQFERQISETNYWVKGPVAVNPVPVDKLSDESAQIRCWKLSVGDLIRRQYFNEKEPRNWSLTALEIEEKWRVTSAMYLEKRGP
jgi:hypothetical protein